MKICRNRFIDSVVALLVMAAVWSASADVLTNVWARDSGENDWNEPTNWTPSGPPGATNLFDFALIPKTATGIINYNTQGPTFSNLMVQTTGPTSLTLNVNAPMVVLRNNDTWANGATKFLLHIGSGGSIIVSNATLTLRGGQAVIEPGGLLDMRPGNNVGWLLNGAVVTNRGSVLVRISGGNNPTKFEGGKLINDGGFLDMVSLTWSQNNGYFEMTKSGGIAATRGSIVMTSGWSPSYSIAMKQADGVISNGASYLVGGANASGTQYGGKATATLLGGIFEQGSGYVAVGYGRVGELFVSGTVFRAAGDLYVGGGATNTYAFPNAGVGVTGVVVVADGTMTFTHVPQVMSATVGSSSGARFMMTGGSPLRAGQRIVFTNLSSQVSGLSTGVEYYATSPDVYDARYFWVTAYPGGPNLGTVSGSGSAVWVTRPSRLSVGNDAYFIGGSQSVPGILDVSGGALTVDQLVATNGSFSVVSFNKGALNILVTADVSNGVPFVVGNGTAGAVLGLAGTVRFADGVVITNLATLAIGGTNAIGAVALNGNLTLSGGAVLDVDFDGVTNDYAEVAGTVVVPENMSLIVRAPAGASRPQIPVLAATGGISGSTAAWPVIWVNDFKYRAVVSGNTLSLERVARGTWLGIQ